MEHPYAITEEIHGGDFAAELSTEQLVKIQEDSPYLIPSSLLQKLGDISIISREPSEKSTNVLKRNRSKLILGFIVTLFVIIGGILFLVIRPRKKYSSTQEPSKSTTQPTKITNFNFNYPTNVVYDKLGVPILPALDPSFMIIEKSTFDDSKRPNDRTPPLNQPFSYGGSNPPIRGVNLGGWLVLEPFITPSFFNEKMKNEKDLVKLMQPGEAKERLIKHYNEFINETDFEQMRNFGLNHVRIPIGFWAIETLKKLDEPYVPLVSWQFLLRGINWARKYGLRVYIDLHVVPGGDEKGQLIHLESNNSTLRTLNMMRALANFFKDESYSHVTPLFSPADNPDARSIVGNLTEFYRQVYDVMQDAYNSSNQKPYVVFGEGKIGLKIWSDINMLATLDKKIIGVQNFLVFDKDLYKNNEYELLAYPCVKWKPELAKSNNYAPSIVSAWAATTDDCGKYINGVGSESLIYKNSGWKNRPCEDQNNWQSWSKEKKDYQLALSELQIEAFEAGGGWFFWTWKTEKNVNPKWDYQFGVNNGWIPKNLDSRVNSCNSLKNQHPGEYEDAGKTWKPA
ncbi:hypothetical protein G9A89_001871 [Geosiphon pyriformis]|nr:hypothetical protein G9A89_001871 [Geosiphon pyriformis]